ncbi:hypothetical protein DI392_14200 [Vibrio albus]|uniref:Suppressor of fused-like domain-containing protein n=1 Tax=Vibrio albus TaxID=2200953 RepID=A0A2U3B730_9VIBR|nr:suppressor of fused domain protein [Vibrio albus]PWI32572.1 hypothetical protein DI392_14200 [Vibrio albus]
MAYQTDIDLITKHIEKNMGKIGSIFHGVGSDELHLDICHIKSGLLRRYETLVTVGMSAEPMHVPQLSNEPVYAELIILLPKGWPLKTHHLSERSNCWPIHLLKSLALYPHTSHQNLGYGSIITNGNSQSPEPYSDHHPFCASILLPSVTLKEKSFILKRKGQRPIYFFTVVPLLKNEWLYTRKHGNETLIEQLNKQHISDIVNLQRDSVIC